MKYSYGVVHGVAECEDCGCGEPRATRTLKQLHGLSAIGNSMPNSSFKVQELLT